ncbi:MAG: ribonuclease E/G [Eubacteriales bacterium]|nr:ribonuclease E/G [Eubacteriales bacterium]
MSRLIITGMEIYGKTCVVCALEEEGKITELRLETEDRHSILGNIYVGQVERLAPNISAAFVQIAPGKNGYFPLDERDRVIYASGRKGQGPLRPGDQILVQVSRDAMKGKLPALTANLNLTGKYLVLTTGDKKFGLSAKLDKADRSRLSKWMEEEIQRPDKEFGLIVRTNGREASKEELLGELSYLKGLYDRVVEKGKSRTCFSLLYHRQPEYMAAIRDTYTGSLEEIVTDLPEIHQEVEEYLKEISPEETLKLRLYQDRLLPLSKLYRLERALDCIRQEKVWLDSGGFLVIQQTEAFVSIDVNSGKYEGKKKAEETYRRINLEAAREIARQLRLRNLSGIILIDFINMENPDHRDELFHVLQKLLRKDPVRARAIDITPLNILEMTRKKVRRPVIEDLRDLRGRG